MSTAFAKALFITMIAAELVAFQVGGADAAEGQKSPVCAPKPLSDTVTLPQAESLLEVDSMAEKRIAASDTTDTWEPDEEDVLAIAKTIYGEARGVKSKARQAAVGWCILNRVDAGFADSVKGVASAPGQFAGYKEGCEPPEEFIELARDVLTRHHKEALGETDCGRTLPKGWCYFTGDGEENHFTKDWKSSEVWGWSLPSPYEETE